MLFNERSAIILEQLQLRSSVKTSELTALLGVSVDTVRRDLKTMEQNGIIKYLRGGACLPETVSAFDDFGGREVINIELKRCAALKALNYIKPDGIIALNSGTTNTILAQEIVKRFDNITVITNNIAVLNVLMQKPTIKVIVPGGFLDSTEKSLYGYQCEQEIGRFFPDVCFLSINAFNHTDGFTDFRFNEMGIIQILASNSKEVIAVMDSSKLGKRSKEKLFDYGCVDRLIMDDNISDKTRKLYFDNGISIE